jgi:hypothetical protein
VTCTTEAEAECTVRNHDHLRSTTDTEITYVKTGCEGGFAPGSFNDDESGPPQAGVGGVLTTLTGASSDTRERQRVS